MTNDSTEELVLGDQNSDSFPVVSTRGKSCLLIFPDRLISLSGLSVLMDDEIAHIAIYEGVADECERCHVTVNCSAVPPYIEVVDAASSRIIARRAITHGKQDELNERFHLLSNDAQ